MKESNGTVPPNSLEHKLNLYKINNIVPISKKHCDSIQITKDQSINVA
jgi:hypothetical protein